MILIFQLREELARLHLVHRAIRGLPLCKQ
jgi:hypothetical protein